MNYNAAISELRDKVGSSSRLRVQPCEMGERALAIGKPGQHQIRNVRQSERDAVVTHDTPFTIESRDWRERGIAAPSERLEVLVPRQATFALSSNGTSGTPRHPCRRAWYRRP